MRSDIKLFEGILIVLGKGGLSQQKFQRIQQMMSDDRFLTILNKFDIRRRKWLWSSFERTLAGFGWFHRHRYAN